MKIAGVKFVRRVYGDRVSMMASPITVDNTFLSMLLQKVVPLSNRYDPLPGGYYSIFKVLGSNEEV